VGTLIRGRPGSCSAADGTVIYFETYGDHSNPAIFLGPHFYMSRTEEEQRHAGPWIESLKEKFFLIVADYPRGTGRTGSPQGLAFNPGVAAEEYGRIADAANVGRFGWVGYSFGGAMGLQVACRTDRVTALAIGGFPPLHAPYQLMVDIHRRLAGRPAGMPPDINPGVILSAIGFYTPLASWQEHEALAKLAMPRMVFMGSHDEVAGETPTGPFARILNDSQGELAQLGWQVVWLAGEDHQTTLAFPGARAAVVQFLDHALRSS
jgi:pimeloyl-ACP methyl ester carboxylesterase